MSTIVQLQIKYANTQRALELLHQGAPVHVTIETGDPDNGLRAAATPALRELLEENFERELLGYKAELQQLGVEIEPL